VAKNSTVPTGRKISIVFLSGKLAKILLRNGPEVSTTFPILSLPASLLFSLSLAHLSNTVISLSPGFPDPDPAYFLIADPVPDLGI
jgi:hypothetical protein